MAAGPAPNGSRMAGAAPRTKTAPLKASSAHSTPSSLSSAPTNQAGMTADQAVAAATGQTVQTAGQGIVSCLDYGLDEDALLARRLAEQIPSIVSERVKRGRKSKTEALSALSAQADRSNAGTGGRATPTASTPAGVANAAKRDLSSKMSGLNPGPARNPMRKAQTVEKAPALDMATVRTVAPREEPPKRNKPRLFGLEHCPVFYPTVDEFAQPMVYMQKVGKEAREYGIAKIVPPEGWKPPFVLDTETFRFKTRLQRLNSMDASARANINFLEQLYVFHKQQGVSRIKVPIVNGRPVDLWRVRREVGLLGGFDVVTAKRKWATMAKSIGYDVKTYPAISFQLKTAYQKIIAPFEDYLARVKSNGKSSEPPHPAPASAAGRSAASDSLSPPPSDGPKTPELGNSEGKVSIVSQTPAVAKAPKLETDESPVTIERVREAAMKLNSVLGANAGEEEPRARALEVANPAFDGMATGWEDPPDRGGEICEICGSDEDDPNILLCDCCDKGYHLQCLNPPLESVPDGNWYCDACIVSTGNEFGFEEGKEHSLHSFQRRADGFKRAWLERHPLATDAAAKLFPLADAAEPVMKPVEPPVEPPTEPVAGSAAPTDEVAAATEPDVKPPVWQSAEFREELAVEDHIEREFWRLVESQTETVEIEYGADVHSSTFGSGLPTPESQPFEPYSRDGWNLNNLPIAPGSLLRYIKSDIAGMTRPWLYVGMVFSTFAWHKEDHYTYSVNYHHWGDTKTWYGVPGADDVKLEEAMKKAAPELFEQQPDLMYQLVTLLSPGRLQRGGVRTYVCDQRPNEFVITCPRSYHAGFNHGLNFNEAVNFCLPDWLADGLLCVEHYRGLSKVPVFSHDELLVTLSQHEKNPKSSRWLLPHFKEMVEREAETRAGTREAIDGLTEEIIDTDLAEADFQCHQCKTFSYLSQIISPGCPRIACHEHTHVLGQGKKIMRLRYTDEALAHMLHRVKARSDKAGRVADLSLAGEPLEQRTSGRKRKPSTALLEAAGADIQHISQRMKTSHRPSTDLGAIAEEEDMDVDSAPQSSAEPAGTSGAASDAMDDVKMEDDVEDHDDEADEDGDEDEDEAPAGSRTIAMAAPDPVPALDVSPSRAHGQPQLSRRVPWSMTTDAESPPVASTSQSTSGTDTTTDGTPGVKRPRSRKLKPPSYTKNGKRRGRPPKSEAARIEGGWHQFGPGAEPSGSTAAQRPAAVEPPLPPAPEPTAPKVAVPPPAKQRKPVPPARAPSGPFALPEIPPFRGGSQATVVHPNLYNFGFPPAWEDGAAGSRRPDLDRKSLATAFPVPEIPPFKRPKQDLSATPPAPSRPAAVARPSESARPTDRFFTPKIPEFRRRTTDHGSVAPEPAPSQPILDAAPSDVPSQALPPATRPLSEDSSAQVDRIPSPPLDPQVDHVPLPSQLVDVSLPEPHAEPDHAAPVSRPTSPSAEALS